MRLSNQVIKTGKIDFTVAGKNAKVILIGNSPLNCDTKIVIQKALDSGLNSSRGLLQIGSGNARKCI